MRASGRALRYRRRRSVLKRVACVIAKQFWRSVAFLSDKLKGTVEVIGVEVAEGDRVDVGVLEEAAEPVGAHASHPDEGHVDALARGGESALEKGWGSASEGDEFSSCHG